jgi:hypothetical protein
VDRETLRRAKGIVEEFLGNDILEEVFLGLTDLVHPQGMGDVMKSVLNALVERKQSELDRFTALPPYLLEKGFLSLEQMALGVRGFLSNYDDLIIDVPQLGRPVSVLLAAFLTSEPTPVLNLSVFTELAAAAAAAAGSDGQLDDDEYEMHQFAQSPHFLGLVLQTLAAVDAADNAAEEGEEPKRMVERLVEAAGDDFIALLSSLARDDNEALLVAANKHGLVEPQFILKPSSSSS